MSDLTSGDFHHESLKDSTKSILEIQREIWDLEPSFRLDSERVYLDHNATSPTSPLIKSEISNWVSCWGNPSSIHGEGRGPKSVLRESRKTLANLIGSSILELIFTGGGSESNNLALKGVVSQMPKSKTRWVTSKVEHPSVARVFDELASKGHDVQYVRINRAGELDWEHYLSLLTEETALVSVMLANNETGTIFPIKKMVKEAHKVGALFHTDAVQSLGKIPVNVSHLGVDLASFSGHKFYSLKGVGLLYCRKGLQLDPLVLGGGQERHRRAGTENLLAIRSFAEVAKWKDHVIEMSEKTTQLRDRLQEQILAEIPDVHVNGVSFGSTSRGKRLPNTLSLSISGVDGESLLMNLDMKGFAVSTGAACSAGSPEPSPTLLAMGLTREEAQSSLRLSLGWGTREEHLDRFVQTLKVVVERLRRLSGEVAHEVMH